MPTQITHTDSEGTYRFAALPAGAYSLRAELNGYVDAIVGPVSIAAKETRKIDLVLGSPKASEEASEAKRAALGETALAKPNIQPPAFYDEPQFTVAGVTAGLKFWRTRLRYSLAHNRSARQGNGVIK